jgi:hypothetical protein
MGSLCIMVSEEASGEEGRRDARPTGRRTTNKASLARDVMQTAETQC